MKLLVHITFVLLPLVTLAQKPHPILRSFSAIKQPNGIALKWVILGGQQCDGTRVFRAEDSIDFEQIEHIEGICGSQAVDVTYTYFDNNPASNVYNRYKLEMGLQGFTDTVTVFFEDFGSDDFLLLSDYASQSYRILFTNDNNNQALLSVYDLSGKQLYQDQTNNNDIAFSLLGYPAGMYIFRISGVGQVDLHGKIYFSGR